MQDFLQQGYFGQAWQCLPVCHQSIFRHDLYAHLCVRRVEGRGGVGGVGFSVGAGMVVSAGLRLRVCRSTSTSTSLPSPSLCSPACWGCDQTHTFIIFARTRTHTSILYACMQLHARTHARSLARSHARARPLCARRTQATTPAYVTASRQGAHGPSWKPSAAAAGAGVGRARQPRLIGRR